MGFFCSVQTAGTSAIHLPMGFDLVTEVLDLSPVAQATLSRLELQSSDLRCPVGYIDPSTSFLLFLPSSIFSGELHHSGNTIINSFPRSAVEEANHRPISPATPPAFSLPPSSPQLVSVSIYLDHNFCQTGSIAGQISGILFFPARSHPPSLSSPARSHRRQQLSLPSHLLLQS
ncbi:hypothetical protein HHK36_028101 [Tetracentron sinense]|uniref:Uncharacterized protein n=1 Tax=Tetracentron sinense TaxID=13715 RepID=A0A834YF73_TETSI|nr:hypothetical protein HHK36_028101 [Tetracentron sinense]